MSVCLCVCVCVCSCVYCEFVRACICLVVRSHPCRFSSVRVYSISNRLLSGLTYKRTEEQTRRTRCPRDGKQSTIRTVGGITWTTTVGPLPGTDRNLFRPAGNRGRTRAAGRTTSTITLGLPHGSDPQHRM